MNETTEASPIAAPTESVARLRHLDDRLPRVQGGRFLVLGVGIPLAVYVAYTLIGGIRWPSYLLVSMAALGAMTTAIGIAAGRIGASAAGADRGLAGRAGSALLLAVVPILLLVLFGFLGGMRSPDLGWGALVLWLWVGVPPFVALGLLLGPLLDPDTGDVVLLGLLVVLAILGGLFQPVETLPAALGAVAQVLPSYHLADLGRTAITARSANPVDLLVLVGYTVAIGAVVAWRDRSEDARGGG